MDHMSFIYKQVVLENDDDYDNNNSDCFKNTFESSKLNHIYYVIMSLDIQIMNGNKKI